MSFDLVLKPCCDGCGSTSDLYGSNCKDTTLCLSCGKTMAANRGRCHLCGAFITKLIRAATNGPAAFGEIKNEDVIKAEADGSVRLKKGKSNDDGNHSDKGEEHDDEEEARKNRLGLNKKAIDDDEGAKGGDFDLDDEDIEKGVKKVMALGFLI
ncbi:hypothetical protein BHE74_00049079 [Ensete ventricosum]|nr:hypothetical protein BHE74_00049079 [Ensete ventricosum]RZS22059.1 hypothetical protein BHM03_00054787 [Ensete ventricosum]